MVLFGIAAVLIFLGVTVLTTDRSTHFEFLNGAIETNETESIDGTLIGTLVYHYQAIHVIDQNLNSLRKVADKELVALKWKKSIGKSEAIGWRDDSHDTNLIMFDEGTRTRVWIIKSRPPTALDKVRIWLKDRLPFLSPKSRPGSPP